MELSRPVSQEQVHLRAGTLPVRGRLNAFTIALLGFLSRRRWLAVAALAGPGMLLVLALVVVPAVVMICMSLWDVQNYSLVKEWNIENYKTVFTDKLYTETLFRSVRIAAVVTFFSVLLATPVAYVITFKIRRRRTFWFGAVIVALWVGYLLRIYAWRIFLGQDGVLNGILMWLGISDEPVMAFLFNDFAIVLALVHLCTPFALVPIYAVMQQVPDSLHDAAFDLYASRIRSFFQVTLPLCAHGIVAGGSFAFILSFGDYYAPTLIGGPGGALISNIAASQFGTSLQWPMGAAIGMVMFAVVLLVLAIPFLLTSFITRRRRAATAIGPTEIVTNRSEEA